MAGRRRGHATGVVLMYHRIGPTGPDPWQLAVTPEHFTEHLAVIKKLAHPAPLARLVSETFANTLVDKTVAITFDDGYADNLLAARPLLAAADVPATVYVTTGPTGTLQEFWWDELEQILLLPETLPSELHLRLTGGDRHWTLRSAATGAWTREQPASQARLRFHHDVWAPLRALPAAERTNALDQLRGWCGVPSAPRSSHRVMTATELHAIEDGGLIEIGAHTVTHPFLPDLGLREQDVEMKTSMATLQAILGHGIRSFSYPFGGATPETMRLAKELGVEEAVGIQEETTWQHSNRFLLPRFAVRNWTGDEFERRLGRWFSWHTSD